MEEEYLSKTVSGSTVYLEEIPEDTNAISPEEIHNPHLDAAEVELELSQQLETVPNTILEGPRRSERIRQAHIRYGLMITDGDDSMMLESDDPITYREAMGSPDSDKWLGAMKEEMKSMYDNQVWDLVDATPGIKVIGCKWVYKIKHDMYRNSQTYKARLVAKGFRQTHGVEY